jgi:hypothetical protein
MNVLDENIIVSQREQLHEWRIPFRQIGYELGNRGAEDPQLLPILLHLKNPTFFTRDFDFFSRRLCHSHYCLAWLNVRPDQAAFFIRRFLSHPNFRTHDQRLGKVVRIHPEGVEYWISRQSRSLTRDWPAPSWKP